ncbi:MAG TPA: hypothetical protein VLZ10_01350, partial [Thermodesulfobacteriota bacterium]|nr:hypothetical protein [Thermodesulfobacteriota bacterium]
LSIASSLGLLTYHIQSTLDRVRGKSEHHIVFSDQAAKEVSDIFRESIGLLRNLPDLLATESKSLAQRVGEQGRSMFKIADSYSEDHEDRLMNGICVPNHSPLYLGIIESLKGVIVQTLAVSGKIVLLSSKS